MPTQTEQNKHFYPNNTCFKILPGRFYDWNLCLYLYIEQYSHITENKQERKQIKDIYMFKERY